MERIMDAELDQIQVMKRDGSLERFDEEKIARICEALGLSPTQERDLLANIEQRVKSEAKEGKIPSTVIRQYVVDELKKIDEYVAEQFIWYYKIASADGKAS